jgi:hypothetical protein
MSHAEWRSIREEAVGAISFVPICGALVERQRAVSAALRRLAAAELPASTRAG